MKKYFIQSTFFHLLFIGGGIFLQWWSLQSLIRVTNVHIVEKSVRVDVVELPKLTLKELKWKNLAQTNTGEVVSRLKKVEGADDSDNKLEFKVASKKKKLNDLLSSFSKKEIPRKKTNENNEKDLSKVNSDVEKLILAGNKLSMGKDLEGKNRDTEGSLLQIFGEAIVEQIRPYWRLPQRFLVSNLSCQVKLFISPTGKLTQIEIFKGSGEAEYDKIVIDAIKKASPFPAPNGKIASNLQNGELVLGFPL